MNYPLSSWFCPHCGHQNQLSFKHCTECGTALPVAEVVEQQKPTRSEGFTTKQLVGFYGLALCGIAILIVIAQDHGKNVERPHAADSSPVPSPSRPAFLMPENQTRIVRVRPLFEEIQRETSFAGQNLFVVGQLTSGPDLCLLVLEKTWGRLTKKQQVDLTWYVESLIPSVRSNPESFITIPKNSTLYQQFVEINKKLCDECWNITVGNPIRRDGTITMERTVVEGDAAWAQEDQHYGSVKASEFRK